METEITLAASDMVGSYHKLTDGIWGSPAGTVITTLCAIAAVILLICLIIAGIFKGIGHNNQMVSRFCPDVKRVLIILLVCFFLAGPTIVFPILLKVLDWFINAFGNTTINLLNV
ncbi:hypothetical protein [Bifidobacterium sp. SO1]|uniref:hypothetical protein n=1 Tax=Bifidobacterium sp. SO1 TaxID=2809029 RepID=UPI001BDDC224|nr:hypothetical protein [Bifidobacterium sp. SO1]MBT1162145.1 hypothetical protein [Bifidobacterium sp. SO1]